MISWQQDKGDRCWDELMPHGDREHRGKKTSKDPVFFTPCRDPSGPSREVRFSGASPTRIGKTQRMGGTPYVRGKDFLSLKEKTS